ARCAPELWSWPSPRQKNVAVASQNQRLAFGRLSRVRISPSPLVLRKHPPNLGHDRIRRPQNVPRGKSEQSDPVTDETVLTSVVLGQPVAMNAAVILDREPVSRVVEIRAGRETGPAGRGAIPAPAGEVAHRAPEASAGATPSAIWCRVPRS